jgi:type IV secretory pathway TrbF-like protein
LDVVPGRFAYGTPSIGGRIWGLRLAASAPVKRNWVDAYHLVTKNGANQLNAYVKDNDPLRQIDRGVRVSVQVNVVVPVTRETWQVDWTETTWGSGFAVTAMIAATTCSARRGSSRTRSGIRMRSGA